MNSIIQRIVLVLAGAILLLGATSAYADTLTFTGSTANGEYGPYGLSLNGSTATPMICFSDNNWISSGESWTVQAYNIGTIATLGGAFAGTAATYNELGYLANELFANPGNSDLQLAIWSVFGLSSPFTATAGSIQDVNNAISQVNAGYVTSDVFYIPTGSNLPQVNGTTPQPFISQVPEPSILVLLSAGLLGVIALLSKKVTA
ncbi:MAG: PEP-CTERM sorting domain-containing protein [Candidatus Acidiferrum sp.]